MTLGTLNIARGLTNLISGGRPISGLDPGVRFLGSAQIDVPGFEPFGVPVSAIVRARRLCRRRRLPQQGIGRPPHLRGRRQPAGGPRQRHQRRPHPPPRLHALRLLRRARGAPPCRAHRFRLPQCRHRRRARRDRGGHHRRRQLLRRARHGPRRVRRRAHHGAPAQRPQPHERQRVLAAIADRADHHPCRLCRRAPAPGGGRGFDQNGRRPFSGAGTA